MGMILLGVQHQSCQQTRGEPGTVTTTQYHTTLWYTGSVGMFETLLVWKKRKKMHTTSTNSGIVEIFILFEIQRKANTVVFINFSKLPQIQ